MMKNNNIYFDNAATTKPNADVVVLHSKIETENFGNSSSIHHLGIESAALLSKARKAVQSYFKVDHDVIFTSGSTEGNNIAIKGFAFKYASRGKHLITTKIEHPSVLECFKQLEEFGFNVTYLSPNEKGVITKEILKNAMRDDTILVSVMAVNNELGSINPIKELAEIVKQYPKAKFHVDATQAIGKVNIDYSGVDMFCFSSHKIHGIKGSGALLIKKGISLMPIISGGGQESGLRSGTTSVANAYSTAKALTLLKKSGNVSFLKKHLIEELSNNKHVVLNSNELCCDYIVNFSLLDKKAAVVVEALSMRGIYVSSISACHSKNEASSYVIKEVYKDDYRAANTIRVSFDDSNTIDEVDIFIKNFNEILEDIR